MRARRRRRPVPPPWSASAAAYPGARCSMAWRRPPCRDCQVVSSSWAGYDSEFVTERDEEFPRAAVDLFDVGRRGVERRVAGNEVGLVEQVSRRGGQLPAAALRYECQRRVDEVER